MKFENTEVFNLQGALRGMRNPMNSWDKSDSGICKGGDSGIGCCNCAAYDCGHSFDHSFQIGKNDLELAQRLLNGTAEHNKFMRQIFVSVDITAPLYWWSEADTYKIGTSANSCSSMHKLTSRDLTEEDFETCITNLERELLMKAIENINNIRNDVSMTNNERLITMKTLLPASYLQKRTWTANYAVLRNMYFQRHNHRLKQWSKDFVEWIESLPYTKELIMYRGTSNEYVE